MPFFKSTGLFWVLMLVGLPLFAQQPATTVINVNFDKTLESLRPIWAWFGYDEPNYTYTKNGRKLLSQIAALSPVPVYVRTHNLLTTGDGTPALKWGSTNMYTEDANGKGIYNYHLVDSIFDTYVARGMKPLAQIGFMPKALSTHPDPYQHNWKPGMDYKAIETGWAYPPKDYNKWADLVYRWVKHCVKRYGQEEVESWYWEVWNEPNGAYWKGTQQEFFKLYDYAAAAVKRALPTARIGGANVTGGALKWQAAFIKHCLRDTNYATGKIGAPLDAVLFHAKGAPRVVDDTVVMGVRNQLHNIEDFFKLFATYKELKNIPIIIGESDPEGCAACGMATNPENAYRNGTMYSSYTAEVFTRKYQLMELYKANLIGAVTWSFEFEKQPWFAGYRDLATNGVDKPVLNVFRMMGMMSGNRVEVTGNRMYALRTVLDSGVRGQLTDIGALAACDHGSATVMVYNYHDKDKQDTTEELVTLKLSGLPNRAVKLTQYVVDASHSNAYEVWKTMGQPQKPTAQQKIYLEDAGELHALPDVQSLRPQNGNATVQIGLQRQAVALLKMSW